MSNNSSNGESLNSVVTRSKTRTTGEKIETALKPPPPRNRESNGSGSQMLSKEKKEVRMGDYCQVSLAEVEYSYIGDHERATYRTDPDVMIWNGGVGLKDEDIVEYLEYAAHTFRIPVDKALYILHACRNDIEQAKLELHGYVSLDDEWTADDDRVFWYSYNAFGKNFGKIKQLLPHKKMRSIICHYYATKKQQHYNSIIKDDNKPSFELSDDDESTSEHNPNVFYICKNCGASVKQSYFVNLLEVCKACKLYFKVANEHRPANRPNYFEKRITCPKDMQEIASQFEEMAKESTTIMEEDDIVCFDKPKRTVCDDLIEETGRKIQTEKARAHILNAQNQQIDYRLMCDVEKATELLEKISVEKTSSRQRHSHTWTDLEQAAAFHCLVRFNEDYEAVAEVLGSKSTEMVKAFAIEHADIIKKAIEKEVQKEQEIDFEKELPKKEIDVLTIDDD